MDLPPGITRSYLATLPALASPSGKHNFDDPGIDGSARLVLQSLSVLFAIITILVCSLRLYVRCLCDRFRRNDCRTVSTFYARSFANLGKGYVLVATVEAITPALLLS